ncbi:MAG: sigma-70 family RNA polymerase sigma factor [Planctomycetes bacterium]|nr:sigma-70 family RNA polymerase sigma factor [Planctomycetota bacterium]
MSDAIDFQPAELERHRAFLQRLARGLVRGEAAAEDLVQETFVRALERPPTSGATLGAWLARVARRLALDRGRGERRSAQREQCVARPEAVAPHDEALASLELQERLVAALKALSEPYRTTLWLRFHEGLAPAVIAARQATSKKSVESRLTRGLALLRTELDRQAGGDRTQWMSGVLLLVGRGRAGWALPLGMGIMKKVALALAALVVLALTWRFVGSSAVHMEPQAASVAAQLSVADVARPSVAEPAESERSALALTHLPSRAAAPTSLLVRVRWAEDDAPAPGVGLILRPEDDPRGARAVQVVASDGDGIVRVAPIHPGRIVIEADRGGPPLFVQVASEGETEALFALGAGLELLGTVADASGAPISAAEVLLVADEHDWLAPRVVARTAANGSYRVRGVSPEFSLTARAQSFAPALLRRLQGRVGLVRIDFVLAVEGVGLRGLVRDPLGAPVAGALVAVGDPDGYVEEDPERSGGWLEARALRIERTDVGGRFFAPGVLRGYGLAVAVQADGYPLATANVGAADGAVSFVELQLEAPATLSGVVRTAAGALLPGVSLRTIVCDGADGDEVPFAQPQTTSDGAGRFRLELLPRKCVLRLDPPRGGGGGPTVVALELAPGETQRDLVLAADDALRGRVVMPAGTAFDDWYVQAWEQQGSGRIRRAQVGADGSFEVRDCALPPYRLELYAAEDRPLLRRDDVGPGAELLLVPGALGSIQGEFVDEAGLLPAGVDPEIHVECREFVTHDPSWDANGRFAFEQLRAGRYRFTIEHEQRVLFASSVELAPGALVDLGRIASAPLGSLALTLKPNPSAAVEGSVLDAGFGVVAELELVAGRLGVPVLPPGDWFLDLEASGVGRVCAPFSVRPGERTELQLDLVPGVDRSLALRLGEREWDTLRVELRDSRGALVLARRIRRAYWPGAGDGPSLLVRLAVGTFTLEATTDTGLALRTSFDVPALVPQDAPLAFELR